MNEPLLRVRDASRPLVFHITKKHIKTAKCGDARQCVIAQAVRDALPDHVKEIHVGSKITKLIDISGHVIRYATPKVLARALRAFDLKKGWSLPEGEYHLGAPAPSHRLGSRTGQKTGPKVTTRKPHRRALPTRHVTSVYAVVPPPDKPPLEPVKKSLLSKPPKPLKRRR